MFLPIKIYIRKSRIKMYTMDSDITFIQFSNCFSYQRGNFFRGDANWKKFYSIFREKTLDELREE